MQIKMKDVLIGSIRPLAYGATIPSEAFTLKYAAVQWTYTQQKIAGGQGGNTQGAWSLVKNDKTYSV
jgi:type VI secretion system secreted protein Hcp